MLCCIFIYCLEDIHVHMYRTSRKMIFEIFKSKFVSFDLIWDFGRNRKILTLENFLPPMGNSVVKLLFNHFSRVFSFADLNI